MAERCDEALDKVAHLVADAFKGEISDEDAVAEIAGVLDEAEEKRRPPSRQGAARPL